MRALSLGLLGSCLLLTSGIAPAQVGPSPVAKPGPYGKPKLPPAPPPTPALPVARPVIVPAAPPGPAPEIPVVGTYFLESVQGSCVVFQQGGGTVVDYVRPTSPCPSGAIVQLRMNPRGARGPRNRPGFQIVIGPTETCASAASGVVFGPVRVDAKPCGGDDLVTFERYGDPTAGTYKIHAYGLNFIDSGQWLCWTTRGFSLQNHGVGADIVLQDCELKGEQVFRLRRIN